MPFSVQAVISETSGYAAVFILLFMVTALNLVPS
jgi:hypothetical protein